MPAYSGFPVPANTPLQNPQNTQPGVQSGAIATIIASVAKIYTKEQKYNSIRSLDYKLSIFYNICRRYGLKEKDLVNAFPTMLKGIAQDQYYSHQLSRKTFTKACTHLRNFFEGPSAQQATLNDWNALTLNSIAHQNPTKSTKEHVQILTNKMYALKYGLPPDLRSDAHFHNKLILACQGVPACRYTLADPPQNLGIFINKLQSSITTYKAENPPTKTFYTDRRYHSNQSNDRNRGYNNSRNRPHRYKSGNRNRFNRNNRSDTRNSCFICKKPHCRS